MCTGGPPVGRYSCTAVNNEILRRANVHAGTLGYPFWALVDFRRLSYSWCKVNPSAGEGSATAVAQSLVVPPPARCDINAPSAPAPAASTR